jgi:solute carrier family 15 (peptide/histidine transporter), member 3/4
MSSVLIYFSNQIVNKTFSRTFQVFVAAFRKRQLSLPEDLMEMHEVNDGMSKNVELLDKTASFR